MWLMRPHNSHKWCPSSQLKLTLIQMALLVLGTPCKTEQVGKGNDLEAGIKDPILGHGVVISLHSNMLTACRIPTQATVPSYKSFSGKAQGNNLRLILKAEERSACPRWTLIWILERLHQISKPHKRKLKQAVMDLAWLTKGNLSSHRARRRERPGLCLALIVLLVKMSTVAQILLLTSSETWPVSLATRVVLHNRKQVGAKIKINASQIRWTVYELAQQHLEQIMAILSPW